MKGIRMLNYLRKVMREKRDRGASAVEYGLMVAAIAAVIVAIVFSLGGVIRQVFGNTCNEVQGRTPGSPACVGGAPAGNAGNG